MTGMVGGHNNAGADGLLPKVILKNPRLDALHDIAPEELNHGQVYACIHQPERVSSRDHAVEGWQVLESTADNLDFQV
jgi:hypothetical protein